MNSRDALDAVLQPGERVSATVNASPAAPKTFVFHGSLLAITNRRLVEVSTQVLTKLGVGAPSASTVSVALHEIHGCDFRKGGLLKAPGLRNLVVVQTPRGEMAWTTSEKRLGQEFVQAVHEQVSKGDREPAERIEPRRVPSQPVRSVEAQTPVDAGQVAPTSNILGPGHGSLLIFTSRGGAAAKAGHDLVLEVTDWNTTVEIGDAPSITLTADPASIKVRSGSGGLQPLQAEDRADIEKTIVTKVLGRAPITFRSTRVHVSDSRMQVRGTLCIAGRTNDVETVLDRSRGGSLRGSLTISQRSFGITPFSAMFGALKVTDNVRVDIDVRIPPGS